jgi:hypothetical protein
MIPIEAKCAEKAQEIVKLAGGKKNADLENRLRNAMAILQEEGLYAFFLFLQYRNKQNDLEKAWKVLAELLKTFQIEQLTGAFAQDEKKVVAITANLDKLFFTRQILAQTLIYALYGLRSM